MIRIRVSMQPGPAKTSSPLVSTCIKLETPPCSSSTVASSPRKPHSSFSDVQIDSSMNEILPLDTENDQIVLICPELLSDQSISSTIIKNSTSPYTALPPKNKGNRLPLERPAKKLRLENSTRRKTVRFAPTIVTQKIKRPRDEDAYDCQARWYNRDEYNEFRQDMKVNFFMHSLWLRNLEKAQGGISPPKEMCIRGLEKYCFYSNQTAALRLARQEAVLDQQRIQRAIGPNDPMTIRYVAEILSQRIVRQAEERGTEDRRAVY